jgi:hypothetical protein
MKHKPDIGFIGVIFWRTLGFCKILYRWTSLDTTLANISETYWVSREITLKITPVSLTSFYYIDLKGDE